MTSFNPDTLLNLERRTGVRDNDIDDFVRKTTALEEAVRGLREGTLDPSSIKIDGLDCDTDEEKAKKKAEREKEAEIRRQATFDLQVKRREEERELWWSGAEYQRKENPKESLGDGDSVSETSIESTRMRKYLADYSRWDQWVPKDPVTLCEEEEEQKKRESIVNTEFENNNKEFCSQFAADMESRKKAIQKKQEGADALRLRGNAQYKRREYPAALATYAEALRALPYASKTLLNMAQCYIKMQQNEDALEYLSRVTYLDDCNAKAWNRKAFVLKELGRLEEALPCAQKAVYLDPNSADIVDLCNEIECGLRSEREEQEFSALDDCTRERIQNIVDAFTEGCGDPAHRSSLLDLAASCVSEAKKSGVYFQVYMRLSGALAALETAICEENNLKTLSVLFALLAASIVNQKLSILQIHDSGTLAKIVLAIRSDKSILTVADRIDVLSSACSETSLVKARVVVFSNKDLIDNLLNYTKDVLKSNTIVEREVSSALYRILLFIKDVVFSPEGKNISNHFSNVVFSTGSLLLRNDLGEDSSTVAIEILVGCSRIQGLREVFRKTSPQGRSVLSLVAERVHLDDVDAANVVGILINLTFDTDEAVRKDIILSGCVNSLVKVVRIVENNAPGEVNSLHIRCLNLLSRLSTMKDVHCLLSEKDIFRSLCRSIRAQGKSEIANHLIKILASIVDLPEHCLTIADEESIIKSLFFLFPHPCEELGEVTPTSVTLVPNDNVSPILLGNAARCLLILANDSRFHSSLFKDNSIKGVEKLICTMASCSEIRVRKNIAILLAKGCRTSEVRAKIEKFRGIEMMMELQGKFSL